MLSKVNDPLRDMMRDIANRVEARDAIKVDRERAEEDVNYFAEAVLGFTQHPIHVDIQNFLDANERAVVWAPTGFGKSTQASLIRPIKLLCANRDHTVILCSSSRRIGFGIMGAIQATILGNPKIIALWPHMKQEKRPGRTRLWNKEAIIVERSDRWYDEKHPEDEPQLTNPSIQVFTTHSKAQGVRAKDIITDDFQNEDTAYSEATRENDKEWYYHTLMHRGAMSGHNRHHVCTPHHVDDLQHELVKERGYAYIKFNGKDYKKLWPAKEKHVEDKRPPKSPANRCPTRCRCLMRR
jgi:hypothetical protein